MTVESRGNAGRNGVEEQESVALRSEAEQIGQEVGAMRAVEVGYALKCAELEKMLSD